MIDNSRPQRLATRRSSVLASEAVDLAHRSRRTPTPEDDRAREKRAQKRQAASKAAKLARKRGRQ